MKKCAYCGRDNPDEALNCRECGTELEETRAEPVPEPPPPALGLKAGPEGGLKTIASLEVDLAAGLLARIRQAGIPADLKISNQEGGLDFGDIQVEECNYDRACDVAEAWEAERQAEIERLTNRFCPRCGSRHVKYVATETFGDSWKCEDCGHDFAK